MISNLASPLKKSSLNLMKQSLKRESDTKFSSSGFFHESLSPGPFQIFWKILGEIHSLKVPNREIFDRSDFPDFYTIKSPLRVGDFGVKIKKI